MFVKMQSDEDRFHQKYRIDKNGCWIWKAAIEKKTGYSKFWANSKNIMGHRYSYRTFVGPLIKGLCLDHLCRNRACVNPKHLEQVTMKENLHRGDSFKLQRSKTHCPKWHLYDYFRKQYKGYTHRNCKTCRKEQRDAFFKKCGGQAKYTREYRRKKRLSQEVFDFGGGK